MLWEGEKRESKFGCESLRENEKARMPKLKRDEIREREGANGEKAAKKMS